MCQLKYLNKQVFKSQCGQKELLFSRRQQEKIKLLSWKYVIFHLEMCQYKCVSTSVPSLDKPWRRRMAELTRIGRWNISGCSRVLQYFGPGQRKQLSSNGSIFKTKGFRSSELPTFLHLPQAKSEDPAWGRPHGDLSALGFLRMRWVPLGSAAVGSPLEPDPERGKGSSLKSSNWSLADPAAIAP